MCDNTRREQPGLHNSTFWIRLLALGLALLMGISGAHGLQASPIEISPGITIEQITKTPPDSTGNFPYQVGVQRIVLAPGTTLNLEKTLGYGYAGPVQYFVESGVLTVDHWANLVLVTTGESVSPLGQPHDGAELGAGQAIFAADGKIGSIRNNSAVELQILAIAIVPTPEVTDGEEPDAEVEITVAPED